MIDFEKAKQEIKEEMEGMLFLSKDEKELHYHGDFIEEEMDSLRVSEAGEDQEFYEKMAILFLELEYEVYAHEDSPLVASLVLPAYEAVKEIIAEKRQEVAHV